MGKMQREKGARLEREVVTLFKAFGFDTARRTGEYVKNDVLVAIDTRDWIIEVKGRKRGFCSLYDFLAESNAVVHRADNREWLITMPFKDFLYLKGDMLKDEGDPA